MKECPICFNVKRHNEGCPIKEREGDAFITGMIEAVRLANKFGTAHAQDVIASLNSHGIDKATGYIYLKD